MLSVTDQRATDPVVCAELFPCRELLPTDEVRERAAALVRTEPWGREQWERLAEGATFEGMESWLPWLTEGEHLVLDLLGPEAQVLLVEPRRMRDRAAELLDEEASLASTLAQTWGAGDRGFPRLHLPFDRLLAHTDASAWTILGAPESPATPAVAANGWDPVVGDGDRLAKHLAELLADRFRVVVAADGAGSAARVAEQLRELGVALKVLPEDELVPTEPGGFVVVAPLERGVVLPSVRVAVLAEADVTGRRRAHRRAGARRTDATWILQDLQPGDYVVHYQHGVGRYAGMVTRAIGGVERDYLLLEDRGGDKLYVPSDQIDAVRHYTGGESPSLHRLGGSDFARTKAKVRAAVREIAQELVVLYRRRVTSPGHAFPSDTPWQRE